MTKIEMEIERSLRGGVERQLKDRKIVLFGISDYEDLLYRILERHGYTVFAVIDNNPARHNMKTRKAKIYHTSRFFEKYDNDYIFLIVSGYYEEMKAQLEEQGYAENIHIFEMVKIAKPDLWHSLNDMRLEMRLSDVMEGRKLHKRLLKEYGENTRIILWVRHSIGEVYIVGFYIKEYLKSHKNCLFVFENKIMLYLAEELGFDKVLYLTGEQIWALIHYAEICGLDKINVESLYPGASEIHFRILNLMLVYKGGVNLVGVFREMLELPYDTEPDIQKIHSRGNTELYFEKYGLKQERTVILAPKAQTLPMLEDNFWELLAERLNKAGYSVCTNVDAIDEEGIKGTIPIFIDIMDMQEFVEKAGVFIALRSGLCDVVGVAGGKKIILYYFGLRYAENIENYWNRWNMKKMGYGGDLSEYMVNKQNEQEVLEKILQEIERKEEMEQI